MARKRKCKTKNKQLRGVPLPPHYECLKVRAEKAIAGDSTEFSCKAAKKIISYIEDAVIQGRKRSKKEIHNKQRMQVKARKILQGGTCSGK